MPSASTPLITSLLQNPYLRNFFILLPFLFLGSLILFLLNRAESLRAGAGLPTTPTPAAPVQQDNDNDNIIPENEELDDFENNEEDGVNGDEDDVDVNDLLAEAGGRGGEDNDNLEEDEVGPAAGAATRQPRNRGIVGKKKARNLEMRDRRRAYSEFLQSQARDRREREKALEDEQQEAIFSEKQRRALAEIKIEKAKAREKEERREAEEKNMAFINKLRGCIAELEGTGKISLRSLGHRVGKDEGWVRKTLGEEREKGLEAVKGGVMSLVTESGWFVRVGREEIEALAKKVESKKKIVDWDELSTELEDSLRRL